jgi:hypothetical protein
MTLGKRHFQALTIRPGNKAVYIEAFLAYFPKMKEGL